MSAILTKGADVMSLRKILQEQGAATEQAFLAKLTPDLREVYRGIIATSWTPVEQQMAIYQAAAHTLFPGLDEPMARLGHALAKKTFTGMYRIFFRIPSIAFIMQRVAMVWRSYYTQGEAMVENSQPKRVDFVVRDFPQLPYPMLEVAKGHCRCILEMTGAKMVQVTLETHDPQAWRWRLSWE
jgi:uncharacterized protein (TIGR02265 family)